MKPRPLSNSRRGLTLPEVVRILAHHQEGYFLDHYGMQPGMDDQGLAEADQVLHVRKVRELRRRLGMPTSLALRRVQRWCGPQWIEQHLPCFHHHIVYQSQA